MPELLDVELIRRKFEKARGQVFESVEILQPKLLQGITPAVFRKKILGAQIKEARRHGKYLFVGLGKRGHLILHFGLTGKMELETEAPEKMPGMLLILKAGKYRFIYRARRLFGMAGWTADHEKFIAQKKLGPDAMEASENDYLKRMAGARGAVKPALMDQHRLAGTGNVYADEILFQARIHPQRKAQELKEQEWKKMRTEMRRIHQAALKVKGSRREMPRGFLMRVRKLKSECPRCAGQLKKISVGGRETVFCPNCQK